MMQEGQRANNAAIAILIASEPPEAPIVPFYRPRSRRTIQRNKKRGRGRSRGTREKERKESEGGRERRWGRGDNTRLFFFSLTECVEILDGHTTNKRDPSDDIELRSAGGDRRAEDVDLRGDQHSNGVRTNWENGSTKPSAMAVYAAGSKSCICHGAMGGVARDWRVPKMS